MATLIAIRDRGLPNPAAGVPMSPWVDMEASGASKIYEFGDSLNLDVNQTLFSALSREGAAAELRSMAGEGTLDGEAVEQVLAEIPNQHAANLDSLMTLKFQRFENVALMAA